MIINIDRNSGFCFGVLKAIKAAEEYLKQYGSLYCLGHIVHNNKEVERLESLGLKVISHNDLENLFNTRVLIRAHGEPPFTYEIARKNNIKLIDASCPVVLKLQQRVKKSHQEMQQRHGQVVIFGKEGHAEVVGLMGQTDNNAIVIGNDFAGLEKIDFSKPISLYSQTTQDKESYNQLKELLRSRIKTCNCSEANPDDLKAFNTICRQVSDRGPKMAEFATKHDIIIFVSGPKSSNGKYLFEICRSGNPDTYFISGKEELQPSWFVNKQSAGVCGATSTPMWLMEEVAADIQRITKAS